MTTLFAAEQELRLTPNGTYTGVCEEATSFTGTFKGRKFAKLKLKIEDALPPGCRDTVFAYIWCDIDEDWNGFDILVYRRDALGLSADPSKEELSRLIGQRFVIKVGIKKYENKMYNDIRIWEKVK